MRVLRNEIVGTRFEIGKIAASAARDDDLAADFGVVLDYQHFLLPLAGLDRAKQSRRTAADNDGVVFHLCEIALTQNIHVVSHVSGHYIGKSACGNRIVARRTHSLRAFFTDSFDH